MIYTLTKEENNHIFNKSISTFVEKQKNQNNFNLTFDYLDYKEREKDYDEPIDEMDFKEYAYSQFLLEKLNPDDDLEDAYQDYLRDYKEEEQDKMQYILSQAPEPDYDEAWDSRIDFD